MMYNLKDRVAVVTGAGQGIGFEICNSLAACGATVILNDVDEQLALEAAENISQRHGKKCFAYAGDVADANFINEMVSSVVRHHDHLDIAIANAGITLFGDFFTYTPQSFQRVVDVNLGGTFFLAQAAAKQMKMQEAGGTLLFMSSVTGHQAHKDLGVYGMTKAAIEMLAKNLVIEVSQYNINVNAIAPGATLTERTKQESDYNSIWSRLTPMQRPASVEDIANAALFLVSPQAKHVTGQTLVVDGGWTSISPSPYDLK